MREGFDWGWGRIVEAHCSEVPLPGGESSTGRKEDSVVEPVGLVGGRVEARG